MSRDLNAYQIKYRDLPLVPLLSKPVAREPHQRLIERGEKNSNGRVAQTVSARR